MSSFFVFYRLDQYGWQQPADVALGYLAKSSSTVPTNSIRFFVLILFALAHVVVCTLYPLLLTTNVDFCAVCVDGVVCVDCVGFVVVEVLLLQAA